jgi:two-component system chemotaxis sensor kinase CheA
MGIDLAQFHRVFFEESFEGVDVMEAGLLALGAGAADAEQINAVFRAAHSIKGGSGTFGFADIAAYTHAMETLLDEIRGGRRPATSDAVDVLRGPLTAARDGVLQDGLAVDAQRAVAVADPAEAAPVTGPPERPAQSELQAPAMPPPAAGLRAATNGGGSIRVDTQKIDQLINMVGELVITQSMLGLLGADFDLGKLDRLREGLAQLERHTRELQEGVMRIRMLPIGFSFNRFPRLVHDLGTSLGKQVELRISGETTEVDKTVVEKIGDPLVHLVRNSLDHGIESPAERLAAGKPAASVIELSAAHRAGNVVIEIRDDGRGLDRGRILRKATERGLVAPGAALSDAQVYELIFLPGFSTAEQVSDVSGRGVVMDVVRRNINELGGGVEIESSPGRGSTVTIRLPLTLAILDGQTVRVGDETYVVPLTSIVESIQVRRDMVNLVAGRGETFRLRGEYLPVIRLHEVLGVPDPRVTELTDGLLVVVESDGRRGGLLVDDLVGQQQVVIKSLEANYRRVDGIAGATIMGDGSVALILDVPGLIRLASHHGASPAELRRIA